MKNFKKALFSFALIGSLNATAFALPTLEAAAAEKPSISIEKGVKQDKFRVLIETKDSSAKKTYSNQYKVRWNITEEGFTTDVNEKQYQALQKNPNLTVSVVPTLTTADLQSDDSLVEPAVSATATTLRVTDQTPWGIKAMYNSSNPVPSGGQNIVVAVLDTGVNKTHLDLVNRVKQCKDFTTSVTVVNNSCADGNGHGTHVAGSAVADGGTDKAGVIGVAPQADLWAYKVLLDSGSGYSDDIAAAIRHAADQATATGKKTVINMSLGSASNNSLISSAVTYAYNKGVLIVAAAGNDGYAAGTIGYPGALVNSIAVAALENVQQNGTYRVADYSSRGVRSTAGNYIIQQGDVEVSAPGSAIYSTWHNGGYNTINGTSMATPHVAGLAAKIWSQNPTWTNIQVRTEIQNRAKANDIKGGYYAAAGDDIASGFGFARVQ